MRIGAGAGAGSAESEVFGITGAFGMKVSALRAGMGEGAAFGATAGALLIAAAMSSV